MKRTLAAVLCGLLLVQLLPLSVLALDYDYRQIRSQYDQVSRPETEAWPWSEDRGILVPSEIETDRSIVSYALLTVVRWFVTADLERDSRNRKWVRRGYEGSTEQSSGFNRGR